MPELTQALRLAVTGGAPLGVAVSGGGDSVALLLLLDDLRRAGGPPLAAVTVDHGLRPEAAEEAATVARLCAQLGVPHDTMRWTEGPTGGNLMDQARRARRRLIAGWARARGISRVALAHTADDQAETFLMRLARGSGVDGLAGMAASREAEGIQWLRPLLGIRRAALRDYLIARGQGWTEDPTNDDPAHDRTRARQALPVLAGLGLTVDRLTATAERQALARDALEELANRTARAVGRIEAGEVLLSPALADAPRETQLRLLARAIGWVTGGHYRPRLSALADALDAPRRATLAGAVVSRGKTGLRVGRELRACGPAVAPGQVWDNRWIVSGPDARAEIRALGPEGLAHLPRWREAGLPRATLVVSPSVWLEGRLLAAPLARPEAEWRAIPARDPLSFFAGLFAH
ncbi:tRNA lysidine(34) synthetase TilS [Neotabrizicola shimadae]|uniref:tRNA(Ile)-lysidine synthase n=1 Tax=Neotabrizicola shimadae TaxID=2807096 RepID=A0A8G0ZRH8_9RHOB|nr:tRNA lysidine(34) synthetase TilS [Neotabrizicola shimadae]QYZ70111.1 tRNA lysidine(34) synthetase TilS [Neotabrizicola shimadae]